MAQPVVPRRPVPAPGPETGLARPSEPDRALARRDRLALPPEPRGAAPGLDGADRPNRPIGVVQRARLELAGLPLSRRIRTRRSRLERMLGSSLVLHALTLTLLALLYAGQGRPEPPTDQTPVEMVFGQSGMVGLPNSADNGGGAKPPPPTAAPQPAPQQLEVQPLLTPPPEQVPVPDLVPLPEPPVEMPQSQARQPTRIPLRVARQQSSRNSAFSNPMDLSFGAAPGPTRLRSGRASGSHAPVDLSLGPLVRNGRLNTPFATVGIKGVSDDYGEEIDSWIRRHLYYPPEAAQNGEDGASHVHVTLDRDGHVRSVMLVNSSGSYLLDGATEGMFRNATLPPVPPDMTGDHFDIDLTVNYILMRR